MLVDSGIVGFNIGSEDVAVRRSQRVDKRAEQQQYTEEGILFGERRLTRTESKMLEPSTWLIKYPNLIYFCSAMLIGVLAGLIGASFFEAVNFLSASYTTLRGSFDNRILSIALSALISGGLVVGAAILVRRYAPEAAGSGVQEVEGAIEGVRDIRWLRILIVKYIGGIMALMSGLVLGREGPTIHMGAATAQAFAERTVTDERERKGLIAAGAAAGLAAAFNAPLAAILFITEETQRQFPYHFRTYMAVILASVTSAIVTEALIGKGPTLGISVSEMPLSTTPLFVLLGVILGGIGVVFNKALVWTMDAFKSIPAGIWWVPAAVVGALTGMLLVVFPDATAGGEDLVRFLSGSNLGITTLIMLTLLRFGGVLASYATGVPGGIFAPMLSIATCAGLAVGTLAGELVPIDGIERACAIAAMGAFFAASVRAPIVGVVLVLELTGAYLLLLPVLATCVTASVVAHHFGGRPIYETLLERRLKLSTQENPIP